MPYLSELKPGEQAIIIADEHLPVKAMELGLMKGSLIRLKKKNPKIGMTLVEINGQSLALDYGLASQIEVSSNGKKENSPDSTDR